MKSIRYDIYHGLSVSSFRRLSRTETIYDQIHLDIFVEMANNAIERIFDAIKFEIRNRKIKDLKMKQISGKFKIQLENEYKNYCLGSMNARIFNHIVSSIDEEVYKITNLILNVLPDSNLDFRLR